MGFIGRFLGGAVLCFGALGAMFYLSANPAGPVAGGAEAPGPEANAQAETEAEVASPQQPAAPDASGGASENAALRTNAAGLQIIKESEGLRLEAYSAGGRWYIGYGHSRTARAGMTITEAEAEALLREDLRDSEEGVKRLITVRINENEFSAMVSLAYNLGVTAFGRSAVVSRLNAGDRRGAADAFLNHNKAGGKVNEHLTERRQKERTLFLS